MIITLTTDFGTADGFVGAMKGVILSIAPQVQIVDITHDIPPCDILAAAITLETACGYFPKGTIHVAVVDPGVGSERAAVAIQTDQYFLVGPDNGVFSLVLNNERKRAEELRLRSELAVRLSEASYHRVEKSATFHGRDIFAPVAAHLTRGIPLKQMGERVRRLVELNLPEPILSPTKSELRIIHVDRYGNLITNLSQAVYSKWNRESRGIVIEIPKRRIRGLSRTFSDVAAGDPVAYFGSGGRLELAINRGNAAQVLKLSAGDSIRVQLD